MKLIAEIAWHHDGDFPFLKSLVKSICIKTNCDYVKFHITLDLDEYLHKDHSIYKWAKKRIFSESQWNEIFEITFKLGKKIMLLLNDKKAIDFGMKYDPEVVEIHSVCLNDIFLLKHLKNKIRTKNTNVVFGVGGTDIHELDHAINFLDYSNVTLMHGFQNYPTKIEYINFNKVKKLMTLYPNYKHGYADHTSWNHKNNTTITLIGASLGMDFIEKHVTILPGIERTDFEAAISIQNFNEIEKNLKILKKSYGDGSLKMNKGEMSYSVFGPMKKAAILKRDIKRGEIFKIKDIVFKRTSQISDLSQLEAINLNGFKIKKGVKRGETLKKNNF